MSLYGFTLVSPDNEHKWGMSFHAMDRASERLPGVTTPQELQDLVSGSNMVCLISKVCYEEGTTADGMHFGDVFSHYLLRNRASRLEYVFIIGHRSHPYSVVTVLPPDIYEAQNWSLPLKYPRKEMDELDLKFGIVPVAKECNWKQVWQEFMDSSGSTELDGISANDIMFRVSIEMFRDRIGPVAQNLLDSLHAGMLAGGNLSPLHLAWVAESLEWMATHWRALADWNDNPRAYTEPPGEQEGYHSAGLGTLLSRLGWHQLAILTTHIQPDGLGVAVCAEGFKDVVHRYASTEEAEDDYVATEALLQLARETVETLRLVAEVDRSFLPHLVVPSKQWKATSPGKQIHPTKPKSLNKKQQKGRLTTWH